MELLNTDFLKELLFLLRDLLSKNKIVFKKARLLNHTTLEIIFLKNNELYATIVTGQYINLYKQYGKDVLPRKEVDSKEAICMIEKFKINWVKK